MGRSDRYLRTDAPVELKKQLSYFNWTRTQSVLALLGSRAPLIWFFTLPIWMLMLLLLLLFFWIFWDRNYCIWACFSFILCKIPEIICNLDGIFLVDLTLDFSFQGSDSALKVIWDESATNYKGSNFYVGWMRGMLVYNDSLSPILL